MYLFYNNYMKNKLILDPIHGYIQLPEICVQIIDTIQFQQLKYKKQLGAAYYVFSGASHNRFEHSIGVAHLAKLLIVQLKVNQPELNISDNDIKLIMIAGLLHDIGHGPLSHLFDEFVISENIPEREHEYRSGLILEQIVNDYNINLSKEEIEQIKKYINPSEDCEGFMYEIISNNRNGLDVDKFDYLMRDTKNIGLEYSLDCSRLIMQARVIDNEICYPEKLSFTIYKLFDMRYRLHKEIYSHPCVNQIELMYADILKSANNFYKITNSIKDMKDFIKLNDTIFNQIEFSVNKELEDARNIIKDIRNRKLYKFIGDFNNESNININERNITCYCDNLEPDDIIILQLNRGYTNSDKNPVDFISFYTLDKLDKKFKLPKDKVSALLPNIFQEKIIRVFCKNLDKIDDANKAFELFCSKYKKCKSI